MVKRRLTARLKGQKLYDPDDFLSPKRLDIAAKTIFARAYLDSNTSEWPELVYREHIRAFNNFYEESPKKNSYDDFRNSFIKTIESVKNDHDWKHQSPVDRKGSYLVNGAHRTAASIVLGDKINTVAEDSAYEHSWDYNFFRSNRGNIYSIDEDVLDYMTIEYVSLKKKDIFIALIFPTAEGLRKEAYNHLLSLGEIVNMKSFSHDEFVGKEVIKQLYFNSNNDKWNYGLDFDSAKNKADLCFDGKDDLQVYVIEANLDESTRVKEKQYLRSLWNKDKHSIHITDTIEEANRVVRMFFNENSRRFMKVDRRQEFHSRKMYDMFNEYISLTPKDIFMREKVAIEGSAVLDLLGIRTAKDIDYISNESTINFKSERIEKHDEIENSYHSVSVDEVLTNPAYYFYYKGYKFVDVLEILKYKEKRAEDKDLVDIEGIEGFIGYNPQYNDSDNLSRPLVSIVVPVYNTKKDLLTNSLDSISLQDYRPFEVIVVDDGSDKETAFWLDKYVESRTKKDPEVSWRVIHQVNSGLSAARNRGYSESQGKYIQFLDSDDLFDKKLLSSAVYAAERASADIVVENFVVKDCEKGTTRQVLSPDAFPRSRFKLDDLESRKIGAIPFNVWSKLFRKDFLDEHGIVHDQSLRRAEDVLFTYTALLRARCIVYLPNAYITYLENLPGSNTKTNDRYPAASVDSWKKLYSILASMGVYDDYKNDFEEAMLDSVVWHLQRLNTASGQKKLADAAVKLIDEVDVRVRNDHYALIELTSIDPDLGKLYNSKNTLISELEERIKAYDTEINNLISQINDIQTPTIKQSTRKLAGSIKRRIKRDLSRVVK